MGWASTIRSFCDIPVAPTVRLRNTLLAGRNRAEGEEVILPRLKRRSCKPQTLGTITARLLVCLMASPLVAVHSHASVLRLAFLSGDNGDQHPGTKPGLDVFDGRWTFTSGGCTNTGSIGAMIRHGRIIVRGGSGKVDPDGTLHSVGAGNGMNFYG